MPSESEEPAIPTDFICPISQEVMNEPVVIQSGMSYDKESIVEWFSHGNETCPMTRQRVSTEVLVPNVALKRAITTWQNEQEKPKEMATSSHAPEVRPPVRLTPVAQPDREYRSLTAILEQLRQRIPTQQVKALCLSRHCLWSNPENASEFYSIGGVEQVKSMLQTGTLRVKWHAAQAINVLCDDSENSFLPEVTGIALRMLADTWGKRRLNFNLLDHSAMGLLLINEMTGKDVVLKEQAAWGLWSLCLDREIIPSFCSQRLVNVILQLLQKGDAQCRTATCCLVQTLASSELQSITLDLRPIVKPLLAMLRDESEICVAATAAALAKIVELDECRWVFVSSGGTQSVLDILRTNENDAVLMYHLALALEVLSTDPTGSAILTRAGGVACLVRLLRSHSEQCIAVAAAALYRLAEADDTNKLVIGNTDAVPVLIACLRSCTLEVKFSAARLLAVLCLNLRNALRFPEAGLTLLLNLLESLDERCRFFSAVALLGLSYASVRFQRHIGASGSLRALLHSLSSYSPRCQYIAASLLKQLGKLEQNRESIVRAGGIHILLDALVSEPFDDCNAEAAEALQQIAYTNEYKEVILGAGAVDLLLRLFVSGPDCCQQAAALALIDLIDPEVVRETLQAYGYVDFLDSIARGTNSESVVADALLRCFSY